MSRAFVKEQDDVPEELQERPISANPNVVTQRGLELIDAEIETARKALAQGQGAGDKAMIARASRDLRYWTHRRSSAQLVDPPHAPDVVAFATRVTILRNDGRRHVYAIVGEDESDPPNGFLAYTSPLARALVGRAEADVVDIPGGEAEIMKIERCSIE